MIGDEEIIFSGKYKGLDFNVRYDLKNAGEKDVAGVLVEITRAIEPYAYAFSGIDCKKAEDIASKAGKDLRSIAKFIRENPVRKQLEGTVKDAKLVAAAESYFFNRALAAAGIPLLPDVSSAIKPQKEASEGRIAFIAKYKEWAVIKKLGLGGAQDWEVSGILGSVVNTAVNKAFRFAGQTEDIGAGKGRKSFGNAADVLDELAGRISGDKTRDAYIIVKNLGALGYNPHANVEMLVAAHPELKPKKPRGRIAGG